ncbi:hypothetical protein JB92DRAFT_3114755 [Gautieria morchelliformis]|nr:hypothetical protein JB92DRAFT_3114755 [Gautieria morchelliformis]
MAAFSWSDTARAVFGSCLPCLRSPESQGLDNNRQPPSARRDELEGLLQGAEFSDAEADTDALSLHSRLGQHDGRHRVKKKRGRKKGSISLFGLDLFGRPLSDPAGEDDVSDREHDSNQRISRISSSTLDSDAAPLADETIAELSTQTQTRQEADQAREARKARRRMHKMSKLLSEQESTFEGFPGSGPTEGEFGAFQQAQPADAAREFVHVDRGGADEAYGDAEGDFDAGSYVRTAAPRSDSGSGTRSRTSASASNTADPIPAHRIPLPPSTQGSAASVAPNPKPKPKRSKKSGMRSATTTSSSTSQPRSPTDAAYMARVDIASPTFEGFPEDQAFESDPQVQAMSRPLKLTGESVHGDLEAADLPVSGLAARFPSEGLSTSGGFPSSGLGGRRNGRSIGDRGAFLARTGVDD